MTEQQTPDREKKIAEIRKSAEEARKTDRSWVDGQDYADDVEFLLDELERLEREYAEERAAHNAHVTELIEKEEECRKMRKELDLLQELAVKVTVEREKERKSAQQEIERLREQRDAYYNNARYTEAATHGIEKLREENRKMIEGLRMCLFNHGCWHEEDYVAYIRDLLKEIGVTVEW